MVVCALLCALLATALGRQFSVRRRVAGQRNPAPRDPAPLTVAETAFLAGGPGRLTDTVIAGMHADGRLLVSGEGLVTLTDRVSARPMDEVLIEAFGTARSVKLSVLRRDMMTHRDAQGVGDRLAGRGLLCTLRGHRTWQRVSTVASQVLVAFIAGSIALALMGDARTGLGFNPLIPLIPLIPVGFVGLVAHVMLNPTPGERLTTRGGEELVMLTERWKRRGKATRHTTRPADGPTGADWLTSSDPASGPRRGTGVGVPALLGAVAIGGVAALEDSALRSVMENKALAKPENGVSGGADTSWCGGDGGGASGCGGGGSSGCGGGCGGCGG